MSEFDEWQGNAPASEEKNENGAGREGYRPSYNRENNDGQSFNRGERPHRPRIARERTSYNANGQADRGFRPSGFGGSYSSDGDQPRQGGYNNGYNQRGGYNNQRGGYNRYISLSRRNSLFFGSHTGAKRAAMFYSLACSCRLQGINFFEYISDVINKAAALPPRTPLSKYRELLPDKWKQKNIAQE